LHRSVYSFPTRRASDLLVGDVAVWVGGGLLCFLGGNMLWSSLREAGASTDSVTSLWGMLVSSFSVSLDSLSAGFSLGMLSTDTPDRKSTRLNSSHVKIS